MLESKRNRIILLFGFILFLAGSFFTLDWTLYVLGLASFVKPEVLYVRITKTCTSFCIALLVWIIGNDGVNVKDTKKLKVCFIAIFAGDLLFLLDEFWASFDLFAVIMFALGHILIIMRNGQSFRIYLKKTDRARERRLDMISLSIIVAITVILYLLD